MSVVSFIYELLFNRKRKKKQDLDLELFHSDDFLRPDHINIRKCPKCKVEAENNKQATEIFGIRHIKGKAAIQSWCRECRNDNTLSDSSLLNNQEKIDI